MPTATTRQVGRVLIALVATGILGFVWWCTAPSRTEREVRQLLGDCLTDLHATPARGDIAPLMRCFTTDIVIELGRGTPPIHGRDPLLAMVNRLQRRIASFLIQIEDMEIEVRDSANVRVAMRVSIIERAAQLGEALDAREFAADVRHTADGWRLSRLVAVDTFR